MAYYVFDDAKNLFEGMTKEQIVNAIAAATGLTPEQIDADVITSAIKEQNAQKSVALWVGTQNEYNAIETPDENTLYCVTDPHETNELQAQVNQLQAEVNELVSANTENASGYKIEEQTSDLITAQKIDDEYFLQHNFTIPENAVVLDVAYRASGLNMPLFRDGLRFSVSGTSVNVYVGGDQAVNLHGSPFSYYIKIVYAYSEAVDLSELTDIRVGYNGTVYGSAGEAVRKQIFSNRFHEYIKQALLNLLAHVAYIDDHGQQYYNALERAMYMTAGVTSITAVFVQGQNVIYDNDDLDALRQYLTVTARFEDQSSEVITEYTLSGTLEAGTSTITVSYGGKTTTFEVTVTSTYLYSLENETITTDKSIATGIDLISQDVDFSICFDASITTKNGAYKLFYEWENGSPYRGATLGRGTASSGDINAKYIAQYKTISTSAASLSSIKFVMTHVAGSGILKLYHRVNGAATTTADEISEAFAALTPMTGGLRIGKHTDANNWAGTVNKAYIRSVALTEEQVEAFMNGA